MDTKNLITFITFAREKSYLKTSLKLNYAPSTLSEHISQLEQELQIKLVETVNRKSVLTRQGEAFLPYAQNILNSITIAKDALDNTEALKGTVTIGTIESLAAYKLESLFLDFLNHYSHVNLIIKSANSATLPQLLKNREFDIVFLYDCQITSDPDLNSELLFKENLCFCTSPGHRLSKKKEIVPADLRHETFLYQQEDCCYYDIFQNLIEKEHLQIRRRLQTDNPTLIKKYVAKGKGISLLPKSMTEEDVLMNKLCYLNWTGERMILNGQMLTLKNRWQSAALAEFIRFSRSYYQQIP
ncbi:MAG: LysR family transcriptional regulator [Eubacteriales bacterium]|nr:LysR family transcriptional regulator [Eubacteriales bacterium]